MHSTSTVNSRAQEDVLRQLERLVATGQELGFAIAIATNRMTQTFATDVAAEVRAALGVPTVPSEDAQTADRSREP